MRRYYRGMCLCQMLNAMAQSVVVADNSQELADIVLRLRWRRVPVSLPSSQYV